MANPITMAEGFDVREMSFQNVLDTILKPAGVKVGGFPQEMFQNLTEEESEKWNCGICFMVVNDCRQCDNKHLFCNTCVFAWTLTYGENSQKCPMCRCDQREYNKNTEVDRILQDKRVHCQEEGCSFKSPLKIYLMHSHGKLKFSNDHVELESLRPSRPVGARMLVLPSLALAGPGANRQQRGTLLRSQLQQGRAMIHQMMMLLHLEMQLRQQSVVSFQTSTEPTERIQRLDEVMALNEQLNEVGTILSALLSTPMSSAQSRMAPDMLAANMRGQAMAAALQSTRAPAEMPTRRVSNLLRDLRTPQNDDEDDSDSDSDSSSDDSSLNLSTSSQRLASVSQGTSTSSVLDRAPVSSYESTLAEGQAALDRARERREISQQILSQNRTRGSNIEPSSEETTNNNFANGSILPGREPGMMPRVVQLSRAQETRNVLTPRNSTSTTANSVGRTHGNENDNNITATQNRGNPTITTSERFNSNTTRSQTQSPLLPNIANTTAAYSMQSTTQALSVPAPEETPSEAASSQTPSEPTQATLPQGSLALRQAMEAINRSRTPGNRLSIETNPTANRQTTRNSVSSGAVSSATQSSTAARTNITPSFNSTTTTRQALNAIITNSTTTSDTNSDSTTRRESPVSRPHSSSSGNDPGTFTTHTASGSHNTTGSSSRFIPQQTPTGARVRDTQTATPGQGAILPASLYRRRSRPDSSTNARSSSTNTSVQSAQRTSQTNRTGQAAVPREPRSVSIGSRQRATASTNQPPAPKQPSPARRTNLSTTRRNPLPNKPNVRRQISTNSQHSTDSGVSTLSSTSSASRNTVARARPSAPRNIGTESSSNLPKLPGGQSRPRRRSEIHQTIVMKK